MGDGVGYSIWSEKGVLLSPWVRQKKHELNIPVPPPPHPDCLDGMQAELPDREIQQAVKTGALSLHLLLPPCPAPLR